MERNFLESWGSRSRSRPASVSFLSASGVNGQDAQKNAHSRDASAGVGRFLLLFLVISTLFGCKNYHLITTPTGQPNLSVTQLLDSIGADRGYELLSSKIAVSYASEKQSQSFGVRVRLKKDSIIWLSITPALGIEIVRLTVTPDTIKLLNRLEKKYFVDSYDNAKEILKVDIDFSVLQAVLTGEFVPLYNDSDYSALNLPGMYAIEADSTAGIVQHRSEIDPAIWQLTRSLLYNPARDEHILAEYDNFQKLQHIVFPASMHFRILGQDNLAVDLTWSKLEEKNVLRFPFNIPAKYVAYGNENGTRIRGKKRDERQGIRAERKEARGVRRGSKDKEKESENK